MANIVDSDQMPQNAASYHGFTVCIEYRNFYKYGNNKNYPDTPSTRNGPVQKVEVGESTRYKWAKQDIFATVWGKRIRRAFTLYLQNHWLIEYIDGWQILILTFVVLEDFFPFGVVNFILLNAGPVKKRPGGRVVIAPDFGSWGLGFESRWRRNSAHDCTALYCTGPFHYHPLIVSILLKWFLLNNVEWDVKHKNIIIIV